MSMGMTPHSWKTEISRILVVLFVTYRISLWATFVVLRTSKRRRVSFKISGVYTSLDKQAPLRDFVAFGERNLGHLLCIPPEEKRTGVGFGAKCWEYVQRILCGQTRSLKFLQKRKYNLVLGSSVFICALTQHSSAQLQRQHKYKET